MKKILSLLAVITLLTSCRTPEGTINVGQPQVFCRERLMVQRQRDLEWAQRQLDNADNLNYTQSEYLLTSARRRDLMNFMALSFKPNTEFKLSSEDKGTDEKPTASDTSMLNSQQETVTENSGNKETKTTSNILTEKKITPVDVVKSQATLSPFEEIKRKKAYRDFLNSYIKEAMLDDFHDTNGYVLYELNFDVSIVPTSNDYFAQIDFVFQKCSIITEDFYPTWNNAMKKEVEQAYRRLCKIPTKTLISNHIHNTLKINFFNTATEEYDLLKGIKWDDLATMSEDDLKKIPWESLKKMAEDEKKKLQDTAKTEDTEKIAEKQFLIDLAKIPIRNLALIYLIHYNTDKQKALVFPARDIQKALAWKIIEEKLITRYSNECFKIKGINNQASEADRIIFENQGEDKKNFIKKINILNDIKPYVLKITPAEINELGSETSSMEDNLILAAMIEAAYKSWALKNETIYKNITQRGIHLLKENTLALTYKKIDGFGILLGPRTVIENYNTVSAHKPRYYNFNVMVAVPAWHSMVTLETNARWKDLNDSVRSPWFKGLRTAAECICMINPPQINTKEPIKFNVECNMLVLNDFFTNQQNQVDRKPEDVVFNNPPQAVFAGEEFQVLIKGKNLWRNPAVYLDGIKASALETTPDMNGVVATFKIPPQAVFGKSTTMSFMIVTSEGQYDPQTNIKVYPPRGVAPFISCETEFITEVNKKITFKADKKMLPFGFYNLKVNIDNTEGTALELTSGTDVTMAELNRTQFERELKTFPGEDKIFPELNLKLRNDDSAPVSVLKDDYKIDVLKVTCIDNADKNKVTYKFSSKEIFKKYQPKVTVMIDGTDIVFSGNDLNPQSKAMELTLKYETIENNPKEDVSKTLIMMIGDKQVCAPVTITIKKKE